MIKSPHLRALIRMVLYTVVIGGIMMGIGYGLNYIYITYGGEGITKTVAAILGLIFGGLTYSAILDEERKKEENPDD
jgi:uncharacterized membrane protein YedE/YeeE